VPTTGPRPGPPSSAPTSGTRSCTGGRICFLFGDTSRQSERSEERVLDAIAFAPLGQNPDRGLDLTFNRQPPLIAGMIQEQGVFEVPLDGVSFGGTMFVFFSASHRTVVANFESMGRSIVARANDNLGLNFSFLRDFSRQKFINVSLEVVQGEQVGLPTFGTTLLIWGTGRYRSSDVYLAAMPLQEIASGRFVRYYAGDRREAPVWATDEQQAVPLFREACVGELSVRFNRFLDRWTILYMSDNPPGILLRLASKPWGRWTDPVMLFHRWENPGMGKYLHIPWTDPQRPLRDWVYDDLAPGDPRENFPGIPYAPGLIAPLTRGVDGISSELFFTLSTWNPYQVMLMTTALQAADLPDPPSAQRPQRILWPRRVIASPGGSGLQDPQHVLGEPDGRVQGLGPDAHATFGEFRGGLHPGLGTLFGADRVTHGEFVVPEELARVDVVAFERNGNAPAAGGGWESCDWTFSDGRTSVSVRWDERVGGARDDHIVANGSIRGADYASHFGLPAGDPIPADDVVSFLLFSLPELRTDTPDLTIQVRGRGSPGPGEEASPDIDAIGLLPGQR
jgi:hypothetical protein